MYLLEKGASLRNYDNSTFQPSRLDETLFDIAVRNNDENLLRLILQYSPDFYSTPLSIMTTSTYPHSNVTVLHRCLIENNYRFIEILLNHGINVNATSMIRIALEFLTSRILLLFHVRRYY